MWTSIEGMDWIIAIITEVNDINTNILTTQITQLTQQSHIQTHSQSIPDLENNQMSNRYNTKNTSNFSKSNNLINTRKRMFSTMNTQRLSQTDNITT